MTGIKEVKMELQSVVDLIMKFRYSADWTCHEYSNGRAGYPIPCLDARIAGFIEQLRRGVGVAEITVSGIRWEESGNCVGDNLYPVILKAVKLPDGRYYFRLEGLFENEGDDYRKTRLKEYIYTC